MNEPTAQYGLLFIAALMIAIARIQKYPIDVKAAKRTLRRVIDTLAKEDTTTLISACVVIVISGAVVGVMVRDWV